MLRRVQDQSDGAFFWKISSGNTRTGMPGFSFLPRLQRWQLVKHLRSLAEPMHSRNDRVNLVPPGDRAYPPGDPDQGVANGQIFRPPYLFSGPEEEAVRPVIVSAPDDISYRGHFDVKVDGLASRIKSVSIIRTDFDTHSLESGEKYVKLGFRIKGKDADGVLKIDAPEQPDQALQGQYMLFVLDAAGVPSVAKHVQLKVDNEGRRLTVR